jgi:capsular polysaccharide biosynthesis protein
MHEERSPLHVFLTSWPTVVFCASIGLLLAVGLSFLRPLEYSSTTRILITLKTTSVDAYEATRSVESIADQLANLLSTSEIYKQVFASGYSIDASYFPQNNQTKFLKAWERAVDASVQRGSGLLTITAYHPTPAQAQELANAVAFVFVTKGWDLSSGTGVTLKVVDEAVNSRYPVRPNFLLNGMSGLILGFLVGAGYLLIEDARGRGARRIVHSE